MDQKAWLWRKKSSEKKILYNGKSDLHIEANVDEFESVQSEKEVELEHSVITLNENIASLLSALKLKEQLAASYEKKAQEATEGKEKAERELERSKAYLDEALQHKIEANERNISLNSALKDCMQQLVSTKNEQETVTKALKELEKSQIETGKKVSILTVENNHLTEALLAKENQKARIEAEFAALIARFECMEKENGFLRHEIRMLEKDVDIRNEEIVFNRESVELLQKQQLEKVKKIKKLETECQRLRVLLHKRIPGPIPLANMRSEFESRGQGVKASRSNPDDNLDLSNKRITFLVDRLQKVEKENKILRDILRNSSSVNGSNVYDDNDTNSSRSFGSALILQDNVKYSEPINTPRHSKIGISDMNLMDDFVEMEKLAIVAVDASSDINKPEIENKDATGKELVVINNDLVNVNHAETSINDWLQNILKSIKEQIKVSERTCDQILQEIKLALDSEDSKPFDSPCIAQPISGYIAWKSPESSLMVNTANESEQKILLEMEKVRYDLEIENKQLKTSKNDLEQSFKNLQAEMEMLKESKHMIDEQFENQKIMNEDIDTQLNLTKSKLNNISHKFSSLQVELEEKNQCCQELEGMCLDLQLQLQSVTSKENLMDNMSQEGKLLQTGWEIKTASAKLAECEAAILNLGNQLKTLTPSSRGNNVNSYKKNFKKLDRRISLLDQILSEEGDNNEDVLKSLKQIEDSSDNEMTKKPTRQVRAEGSNGAIAGAIVVIPGKKRNGRFSFLRKLLLTREKSSKKKTNFSFTV